jgi:uncharacterized protein YndB with AHSA1/START domain
MRLMKNTRIDSESRLIRAAAAAVYSAYVNPTDLVRWLPPTGMTGRIEVFDPRPGGAYRIALTYDRDSQSIRGKTTEDADVVHGRFLELVPEQKIVQSVQFESEDPRFAGEMIMTWLFTPAPQGCDVQIIAENVPEGISPEDHRAAFAATLANLARVVERD